MKAELIEVILRRMKEEATKTGLLIDRLSWPDLPRLLEIERACYPDPWSESLFVNELSNRPFNCPLGGWRPNPNILGTRTGRSIDASETAVRRGMRLVGFAIAHLLSTEAHILNLAVDPGLQGKGYGRMLLHALLNHAAEHGESRALLEVRESNMRAQCLYRSAGFEVVGRRRNYYERQREDALVMALEPLMAVYPRCYQLAGKLSVG